MNKNIGVLLIFRQLFFIQLDLAFKHLVGTLL